MPAHKSPPWSSQETAILVDIYPREGINGAADALADRSWHAIEQRAHKLGLRSPIVGNAPKPVLAGERLEEAIRLREVEGWSFARIGATMQCSEAAACNAVLIALCSRKGFRPAARDATGRLTAESVERLRMMLKKGLKGVDIQLRLGLSAGRIAEERRRYRRDLAARGKAPLPAPGAGAAYSGVKLSRAAIREVEALLEQGFGAAKVTARTGVSNTSVGRIRNRLIKRLARRGETLAGCDREGRRISAAKESRRFIPPEAIATLKHRLKLGDPVARAARDLGIGGSSAYRIRDEIVAELALAGETLPRVDHRTTNERDGARAANWLPSAKLQRYRELTLDHGLTEAKRLLVAEIEAERIADAEARRAERQRPRTFEEQLERVARGEVGLVAKIPLRRPGYAGTLGGIATAAL